MFVPLTLIAKEVLIDKNKQQSQNTRAYSNKIYVYLPSSHPELALEDHSFPNHSPTDCTSSEFSSPKTISRN